MSEKTHMFLEKGMLALAIGSIIVSIFLFLGIGVSEIATEGGL